MRGRIRGWLADVATLVVLVLLFLLFWVVTP